MTTKLIEKLDALKAECDRAWAAVGKPTPCRDPAYLSARYRLHRALVAEGIMKESEADPKPANYVESQSEAAQ